MAELAAAEERWLEALTRVATGSLREFVEQRSKELQPLPEGQKVDTASHPNSAYLMMKAFLFKWHDVFKSLPAVVQIKDHQRTLLPTQEDLQGALSAIIRLQRVFSLPTAELFAGNYSGHVGPALQPMDAYEIGRQGLSDSEPELSVSWLELALQKGGSKGGSGVGPDISTMTGGGRIMASGGMTNQDKAAVMAALGRAYIYTGHINKAAALHRDGRLLDPSSRDVQILGQELREGAGRAKPELDHAHFYLANTSRLCSREKDKYVARMRPYHKCRYKPSLWIPYVTYKEEILSLSPYASLFYGVIFDFEMNAMKRRVRKKLTSGRVDLYGNGVSKQMLSFRSSDLGWIYDSESPIVARLSKRVEDITWLDTDQRLPAGPSSAEAFQVVNYGLGGHYVAHWDPVQVSHAHELQNSGVRIATFLFYLSDVDKGGQTVFINAGMSVAPIKGAALFWYNYNPAMKLEHQTLHAGCPVLKGHKWIANKWILEYGNTFRRPCGPTPNTKQLRVERIVYKSRHGNR